MSHSISHFRQRELAAQQMLHLAAAPEFWGTFHGLVPLWDRHQPDLTVATEEVREPRLGRIAGRLAAWMGGLRAALRRGPAAA